MRKTLRFTLILITSTLFFNVLGSFSLTRALDKAIPDAEVDTAWADHVVDGSGQKIAIIDTGIDWTHPDFFRVEPAPSIIGIGGATHPFGASYPDIYIDLNMNGSADAGEYPVKILDVGIINNSGEEYGSNETIDSYDWDIDYLYIDHDDDGYNYSDPVFIAESYSTPALDPGTTLLPLNKNVSKIEKIWDQSSGNIYERGVNLTNASINTEKDYDGHGTHVAGVVAAGVQSPTRHIVGVAPAADLLFVKVASWEDSYVSDAIDWVVDQGADVISLSFGLFYKNLTLDGAPHGEGGSLTEEAIERAWQAGVPVVTSAGNVGDKNAHATLDVSASSSAPDILTVPSDPTIHQLALTFLWRAPNNNLSIDLMAPGGTLFQINDSINSTGQWLVSLNGSGDYFHYYVSYMQNNSRGTSKAYIYICANNNNATNATSINNVLEPGVWQINVANNNASPQRIEEFVYSAMGDQNHFWGLPGAWFQNANPNMTVTAPATTDNVIVVGSHITSPSSNPNLGNLSTFSSRGDRIDGYQYHMITAPGESITSVRSKNSPGTGNYTTMSGTSMSTPMVAGAIALAMQNNTEIKNNLTYLVECLENSTNRDGNVTSWGSVPNKAFGYGKLNTTKFIEMTSAYSAVSDLPPVVSGPGSITYVEGTLLNQVQWTITDDVGLSGYVVYKNSAQITSGTLSGTSNSTTFNVDGWAVGVYNITIIVNDTSGNTDQDEVTVTVTASRQDNEVPGYPVITLMAIGAIMVVMLVKKHSRERE